MRCCTNRYRTEHTAWGAKFEAGSTSWQGFCRSGARKKRSEERLLDCKNRVFPVVNASLLPVAKVRYFTLVLPRRNRAETVPKPRKNSRTVKNIAFRCHLAQDSIRYAPHWPPDRGSTGRVGEQTHPVHRPCLHWQPGSDAQSASDGRARGRMALRDRAPRSRPRNRDRQTW